MQLHKASHQRHLHSWHSQPHHVHVPTIARPSGLLFLTFPPSQLHGIAGILPRYLIEG